MENLFQSMTTFSEFLQYPVQNSAFIDLVESITYNPISQTIIIQIRDLLRRESDQLRRGPVSSDPDAEEDLKRLSECYRESYPKFLNSFNHWKPFRKQLIRTLNASANKIDRNSSLTSTIRILSSTIDIFGTIQLFRHRSSSWSMFALENAPIFGIASLFLEMTLSKQYHSEVKKIIKEDQKKFEELKKWFKQTEELDIAVRKLFPYGIDKDLVRRIDKVAERTDQFDKIFISIFASNVKKETGLCRNKDFLERANKFASSEAGIQWFHNVMFEDDPLLNECNKFDLATEISTVMTSPVQNTDIIVGTSAFLSTRVKLKVLLSVITIVSAVSNLWNDMKSDDSDALRELAGKAEEELHSIKRVLELLRPSGVEIEDTLQ